MPTLIIPEDTFRRLADRAAALNTTVEAIAVPLLESVPPIAQPLTGDQWHAEREAWKRDAVGRAGRYPPGFAVEDGRDAIYRDRLDAQS